MSGSTITVAGQVIGPKEFLKTTVWVKNHGLVRVDDQPMFNPTILSKRFIKSAEVIIPINETRFGIHFHAEKGYPIIYYNSLENFPPVSLYPGAKWNTRVYERTIDKLILQLTDGDILWVNIERT
jgi:hypothetical protein